VRIILDIDVLNRDTFFFDENPCRCLEVYSFSRLDVVHDNARTAIIE